WSVIVEEYTMRKLSNSGDRLLAISGIAHYYAGILKDVYLAGIWSHDLPAALMWEHSPGQFTHRPLEYRAPSWSWAAIDGTVDTVQEWKLVDPNLSIVACTTQVATPSAPFGAVVYGRLVLKGFVRPARWDGYQLVSMTSPQTEYWASTTADALKSEAFDGTGFKNVCCLHIYCFDETKHQGPSGLILIEGHQKTFKRVGTFSFDLNLKSEDRHAAVYLQLNSERREWSMSSELREVVII
ncbi:hypothetical protein BGZ57DRAFT_779484, partial [Hyaloscypha finlandica]